MAAAGERVFAQPGRSVRPRIDLRIFGAAASLAGAGALVKLIATGKELALADAFGRSDAMDAFVLAALVPGLLVNLVSESMNQALTPTLIRVREQQGMECAQRLLSSCMLAMCVLLAAVSAVMALAARGLFPLLASHFPAEKLNLAIQLFYAMLPLVLISGIAGTCTAVLNAADRFALPALAPALISLSIVAGVLACSRRISIWTVVIATLAGSLLHAASVAHMMSKRGYRLRFRCYGVDEAVREVARQYGPVMLSSVVASGGLLADQAMAAMLPAGSVSALAYANRFISLALALLGGTVSAAVTPHFSRMIAHRDWIGCRQTLRTWAPLTALVSGAVAGVLIFGARPLVRLAFEHGAFGPRDTAVVASVLAMYALQIPFFVSSRVFYRFLVALRRADLIFYCGLLNLVLDVVLDLLLMRWMGVAGIALATSLWTAGTLIFLACWTRKLLPPPAVEIGS